MEGSPGSEVGAGVNAEATHPMTVLGNIEWGENHQGSNIQLQGTMPPPLHFYSHDHMIHGQGTSKPGGTLIDHHHEPDWRGYHMPADHTIDLDQSSLTRSSLLDEGRCGPLLFPATAPTTGYEV